MKIIKVKNKKWKRIYIKDIKTNYFINKNGKIINKEGKIKKTSIDKHGYERVNICINGKSKLKLVHRLVAKNFVYNDNPSKKIIVNHKDGNKLNNNYKNLEWCTYKYNSNHALKNKLLSTKLSEKEVIKICELLQEGYSTKEIYKKMNFSDKNNIKNINRIRNGETWKYISNRYNFENIKKGNNVFSEKEVIKICELLQEGYNINEIIVKLNINSNYKNLIRDIRSRKTYKKISDNYNFDLNTNYYTKDRYNSIDDVIYICELLQEGYNSKQILKKILNKYNDNNKEKYINLIKNIKNRYRWTSISKKYKW